MLKVINSNANHEVSGSTHLIQALLIQKLAEMNKESIGTKY